VVEPAALRAWNGQHPWCHGLVCDVDIGEPVPVLIEVCRNVRIGTTECLGPLICGGPGAIGKLVSGGVDPGSGQRRAARHAASRCAVADLAVWTKQSHRGIAILPPRIANDEAVLIANRRGSRTVHEIDRRPVELIANHATSRVGGCWLKVRTDLGRSSTA